jgi:hypothetical protein
MTVLQIAEQIGYKLAKHSRQTAKCGPFSRWKTPYKPTEHQISCPNYHPRRTVPRSLEDTQTISSAGIRGLLLRVRRLSRVSVVFSSVSSGSPYSTLVANFTTPATGFSTATAIVTKFGFPKSGTDRRSRPLEQGMCGQHYISRIKRNARIAQHSQGNKSQDHSMCGGWRRTVTAPVYLMRNQAQRNQHSQQNNPIYRRCRNLLYPFLLRLRRHALQPMMHDLNMNDYNLTAKVRPQHNDLPRDCEGEEHD